MNVVLLFWMVLASDITFGQESNTIIYNAQSDFNPVHYYFNSAFDVVQNPYYFTQGNYQEKYRVLFKRVIDPNESIERDGGWNKFFNNEFFSYRVAPNLGLHTIGSGYDSREMYEYYTAHKFKMPMLLTVITLYAGHFGNEALELSNENVNSHDNIADLFFFDVAAIALFRNDDVVYFFKDDLGMRRWSFQPFIDMKEGKINNAGLNYIFRPDVFKAKMRPFLFIGMQNLGGLSYEYSSNRYITLSSGIAFTDPLKQKGYLATAIFYDSDELLSASLIVNGSENYKARVNLYPNLFSGDYKLGLMSGIKRDKGVMLGINYILPLGLGVVL